MINNEKETLRALYYSKNFPNDFQESSLELPEIKQSRKIYSIGPLLTFSFILYQLLKKSSDDLDLHRSAE